MSKQLTMWCVFDLDGEIIRETLSPYEAQSKFYFGNNATWRDYDERGYTCRKVRVTIEEVKP